jgi:DNA-binding MarR family transcriptional regulator
MRTDNIEPKYLLCTLITQAARKIVSHYNREFAPMGLTAQQIMALGVVTSENGVNLGEFAKRLKLGKPAAGTMIDRLEVLGFVTKESDPVDARLKIIKPTDMAKEIHSEIDEKVAELEFDLESQMGASNLEALISQLSSVLAIEL